MIKTKTDSRYDIDYDRRVFVYKNLHKNCWSIRQDGLVKAHSDGSPICIYSAVMKVNQKGRERVIREKKQKCSCRNFRLSSLSYDGSMARMG